MTPILPHQKRPRPLHRADLWAAAGPEPRLDEVFADPLVHLLFRRDHLSEPGVRRAMAQAQAALRAHAPRCRAA